MKPIYRYIYLVAFLSMIWNVQAQMPTSAVVIDNTEQTIDYVDGLSHLARHSHLSLLLKTNDLQNLNLLQVTI